MSHRKTITGCFLLALLTLPAIAQNYAVVVNPQNNATLDKGTIAKIFLAKMKSFPGGIKAVPIMQKSGSEIAKKFITDILKKRPAQYKGYWSKMVFTGKGNPPKEYDDASVKELIAKNPNLIGIMAASAVDDSVRVVLKF